MVTSVLCTWACCVRYCMLQFVCCTLFHVALIFRTIDLSRRPRTCTRAVHLSALSCTRSYWQSSRGTRRRRSQHRSRHWHPCTSLSIVVTGRVEGGHTIAAGRHAHYAASTVRSCDRLKCPRSPSAHADALHALRVVTMRSSRYISQSDSFGWLEPQQQEIAVRMLPVVSECCSPLFRNVAARCFGMLQPAAQLSLSLSLAG